MEHRAVAFVAVAALMAGPAWAEKAFIPASDGAVGRGATHRTEITLTNAKGAPERVVTARLADEAGRASAYQSVAVKGGQSVRLAGLEGNGLVELELAKGVEAAATLVVERAGGTTRRTPLPVVTAIDNLSAGSTAALWGGPQFDGGYRKTAAGVINLSGRAMRCSASFEREDGSVVAEAVHFTVAPYAERRAIGGGKADIAELASVRCDQAFWAYGVAEQAATGNVQITYPSKEVRLAASTEATTGSYVFTIPGTFLVPAAGKWSYRYYMYFPTVLTFKKVVSELDVFIKQWDPVKPGGIHMIMWMQREGWATMMKYMNAMKKGVTKYRWNYDPPNNSGQTSPGMKVGNTYHVRAVWDGLLHKNSWIATKNGLPYAQSFGILGVSSFNTKRVFVEFAHSRNTNDGPESRSPGWQYSNYRAEFTQ